MSRWLVERAWGPAWDPARGRRAQAGWDEHAAFMDALVAEGFVVLGGPAGDPETGPAVLVIEAEGESEIRARLAADPWERDVLTTASVRPWAVWLRAPGAP